MSMIKSPAEIALMREAGRVVANTLAVVRGAAGVGVSLRELDALAAETIAGAGLPLPSSTTTPDGPPFRFRVSSAPA